jgi:hypothetical protein
MDDPMQASFGADMELTRRFDDYARGRLTPSDAAKARLRAGVMREARLAFADQAAQAAQAAAAISQEHVRASSRRKALRRGAGVLLAAALSLVAVGGALAASSAGGPLYGARIWFESVTLPDDASARADAEIRRLDARLIELQAAVRSGDRTAVAAALAAYEEIADEALASAGVDQAVIDRLRAALDRHVGVLERVASQAPPQAAESINLNIERAIEHSDAVVQRIQSKPGGPAEPADQAAPPAKPEKSAAPAPTAKPTPKPAAATAAPTPKPAAATAAPTPKAPPAKPSPKPHNSPPGRADH